MKLIAMLAVLVVSPVVAAEDLTVPHRIHLAEPEIEIVPLDVLNYGTLVAGYAMIAWDCRWSADHISHKEATESDPLVYSVFGKQPTAEQFWLAGAVSAAGMTTAFVLLPKKWKWAAPAVWTVVEGAVMAHNLRLQMSLPF